MCTLAIAWQVFDDAPVVVAANREEATDRPASPPEVRDSDPAVVAPRDCLAGGTWIGYNASGVFAGISNRWTDRELAGDRSRGLLVADALGRGSAESAARAVEEALARDAYDAFNLVVADASAAILLRWDGHLQVVDFAPGLHVVTNAGYDDHFELPGARAEPARAQAENASRVREVLAPAPGETAAGWLARAGDVLGDHDYGVCVHGDGYGTRSSSLVALHADGSATYCYADGPPCETAFEPVEGPA